MQELRRLYTLPLVSLLFVASMLPAVYAPAGVQGSPAEPGRGTDGTLTLVYWQEPSIMNSYLGFGASVGHAASLVLEPLLEWAGRDVILTPVLAEEVPTLENGGISEDLMSITYKLRRDVVWSDGTPFTADDVVFTWEYCVDPLTGCTSQSFVGVATVEALNTHTVKVTFAEPAPYPYAPFVGYLSHILQKAQFEDCKGEAARSCSDANTMPIGTGPYKVKEFRANDTVIYEINENYREPNKPHFSEVIFKGAEDSAASARAVLVTGEADYGWNLQVVPDALLEMASRGNGQVKTAFGGSLERILINFTNPDPALGDKRSVWSPDDPNPHPFLTDIHVRKALSMAIDRAVIVEQLYGPHGQPSCNALPGPPNFASPSNEDCVDQNIDGANALLDEGGYLDSDGDGVRETPDGVPLKILYQTSTNSVRQATQVLVKQWWKQIGVETELKAVDAAVFFGGDPASPDSYRRFYADVEMFTNTPNNPDPQKYMANWVCRNADGVYHIARPENNWGGSNVERWCNEEYDALFQQLLTATGEDREQIVIAMNDLLVQTYAILPLVFRGGVIATSNSLVGPDVNDFETHEWNIEDWQRVTLPDQSYLPLVGK